MKVVEFLAGFEVPLKQNRTIDKQRQQLWLASLTRAQVEPEIQTSIIEFTRQASYAYWEWIAAGELLRIAESLLDFAETRENALERLAEEGDRPAIDVVDNNARSLCETRKESMPSGSSNSRR